MLAHHPIQRIAQFVGVLRQLARGGAALGHSQHPPRISKAAGIEIEDADLRNSEVRLSAWR